MFLQSAPSSKVGLGGGQAELTKGGLWLILLFHSSMGSKLSANLLAECLMKSLLDLSCCGPRAPAVMLTC